MSTRIYSKGCMLLVMLHWIYLPAACDPAVNLSRKTSQNSPQSLPGVPQSVPKVEATTVARLSQAPTKEQLRLEIIVPDAQWSAAKPATVIVRVENLSNESLTFNGYTSFILANRHARELLEREREKFSCSVDLLNSDLFTKVRHRRSAGASYHLEARQVLEVSLDVSSLKWQRMLLSGAPTKDLFAEVTPGDYKLYFEASFTVGTTKDPDLPVEIPITREIKSNRVLITIR